MEKLQWDLTEEQAKQLCKLQSRQGGLSEMLRALAQLEEELAERELAWWEDVRLANKIPKELMHNLIADFELRKVWVKGKVSELDNSK